jgi:hypothetical protein
VLLVRFPQREQPLFDPFGEADALDPGVDCRRRFLEETATAAASSCGARAGQVLTPWGLESSSSAIASA